MMLVISNPACIRYLRGTRKTNAEVVERALCRRLCIAPRSFRASNRGRHKMLESKTRVPIKITDKRLENFILEQKRQFGVCYRHTAESAMLDAMPQERIEPCAPRQ